MSEPELIEDFFGVYLLFNINPKFLGRTYIGYTRDPNRRIMQHNRGTWAGGAHRTSNKGPWKMVMIVHGFPNNISALRFEWAWQNPNKTIRLQHLDLKKIPRKESEFQFKLRVLSEMLRVGPWSQLPLLVRWLENEYFQEFPADKQPPAHMEVIHGPVRSRNLKKLKEGEDVICDECLLCSNNITSRNSKITCLNPECELVSHITCIADLFLLPGEFVPVTGECPFCSRKLKWGDLIRKMKGCIENIGDEKIFDDDDGESESDGNDEDMLSSQDKGFVDDNSKWFDNLDNL